MSWIEILWRWQSGVDVGHHDRFGVGAGLRSPWDEGVD
jgi:hypothetical protein